MEHPDRNRYCADWYRDLFLSRQAALIGRLPEDLLIERGNFRLYSPNTTMILASLALTLLIRVISRFMR
jgi:hypothetical protein